MINRRVDSYIKHLEGSISLVAEEAPPAPWYVLVGRSGKWEACIQGSNFAFKTLDTSGRRARAHSIAGELWRITEKRVDPDVRGGRDAYPDTDASGMEEEALPPDRLSTVCTRHNASIDAWLSRAPMPPATVFRVNSAGRVHR